MLFNQWMVIFIHTINILFFIDSEMIKSNIDRDKIMLELKDQGVLCFSGGCPEIYLEKAFIDKGLSPQKRFKVAKELGETSLMFLVHPTLLEEDMHKMGGIIEKVVKTCTK